MKIALIADTNPLIKKGVTNFVHTKAVCLQQLKGDDIIVDCYVIKTVSSLFFKLLTKSPQRECPVNENEDITEDGVTYHVITVKQTLLGTLYNKFFERSFYPLQFRRLSTKFKEYDVLTTHQLAAHALALYVKKHYGIPYVTTWHGSEMNVFPFASSFNKKFIIRVLENAKMNFFVSKKMQSTSDSLTVQASKDHIYTGASKQFQKYDSVKRLELRDKHDVANNKVIAFVGNLLPIKNIEVLPQIFKNVSCHITNSKFWILGDGQLHDNLRRGLDESGVDYTMFGNVLPEEMPEMLNCVDMVVLPSINEGMPLVLLEALSCGCKCVGSHVGGIAEILGDDNVFELGGHFVDEISSRIVKLLLDPTIIQGLGGEFSWDNAIRKELASYSF